MKKVVMCAIVFLLIQGVAAAGDIDGIWGNLELDPNTAYFVVENNNTVAIAAYNGNRWGQKFEFDVFSGTKAGNVITFKPWWASVDMEGVITLLDATHASVLVTKCTPKERTCEFPAGTTITLQKLF